MQTFQINTKEKREATGDLFGIFFEDINHAADGGLYAELIQNRAFEFDPIDNKNYHALSLSYLYITTAIRPILPSK